MTTDDTMTLCLFEDAAVAHLAPLTLTRGAFDLRVGARTLGASAIALLKPERVTLHARRAVAGVVAGEHPGVPVNESPQGPTLFVNARWLARATDLTAALVRVSETREARAFTTPGGDLVALWHPDPPADFLDRDAIEAPDDTPSEQVAATMISRLWDVVADLPERIATDLETMGGLGTHAEARIRDGARLVSAPDIFLGAGATIQPGAILDASDGPIYVAAGASVEHNAVVRGPVYLGDGTVVKALARIDGTAAGAQCRLGGEVHESSLHSFSSKGHDGYLGNSALGRWCNLGAATDTSNLKNDYGEITFYDAVAQDFVPSGRQFLGLVMGDHSKCAIHTAFSTGTVVGVFANVFGGGVPPRHIPSFSWGGAEALVPYRIDKALRVARAVEARRKREVTDAEARLLTEIADARLGAE